MLVVIVPADPFCICIFASGESVPIPKFPEASILAASELLAPSFVLKTIPLPKSLKDILAPSLPASDWLNAPIVPIVSAKLDSI